LNQNAAEKALQRRLRRGDDLRLIVQGRETCIVFAPQREVSPEEAGRILSLAAKAWGWE
jgi:hypothetical protein